MSSLDFVAYFLLKGHTTVSASASVIIEKGA